MAEEISFLHSIGGLVSEAVLSELRNDQPTGPAAKLSPASTFRARDGQAPTRSVHEEDLELAFRTAETSWSVFSDHLNDLDTSRLRERLLIPLLRLLGFDPQFQKAHIDTGRGGRFGITHLGWDGGDAPPLILTAGDLDERDGRRSPHQELQAFLNESAVRWGIVANAHEIRILRDFHHTSVQGGIVIDLANLLEAGSFSDFRALYRLCHSSRFTPPRDDQGSPLFDEVVLEQVYQESLAEGVAVGQALQPQVRRALTSLLNGILEGDAILRERLSAAPALGRELYRELLVVLYRFLFLLYAEQRGLLEKANSLFADSYSVTRLRSLAETRAPEPHRGDLWEGLKATFQAFGGDDRAAGVLGVYPYNGRLFDLDNTSMLNDTTCSNEWLLDAVRALTTVQLGGVRQYVDFRHLGVEELGTVYESLLSYTIRIADEPQEVEGVAISAGQGYLAPLSLERSELGAYYTPPKLVNLTLSAALDELIEDRLSSAGSDPAVREEALLDLRIIDPACGSAAFLVGAIDRVATVLAEIRAGDHQPSDRDVAHARRDVLQQCIYGVDVDPFAAELAKVALWIHCAVDDMPLTFLDHKIVCGNSLVGWPMFNLPEEIPEAAYSIPKGLSGAKNKPTRDAYYAARDRNRDYLSQFDDPSGGVGLGLEFAPRPDITLDFPEELTRPDRSVDDVREKAEVLERYRQGSTYQRMKLAADLWTASFFWDPDQGAFPTSKEYHAALQGGADEWADRIESVVAELNPLHWPLAFPDIYHRGRFDLVVGNPPWEKFVLPEQEFFRAVGRDDIALLTSARRKAAIEGLRQGSESDQRLYSQWTRIKSGHDRMSDWAKGSHRYTEVSGEANTYVLFTELAAQLTADHGWVSMVVKSGLTIDQTPAPVWHRLLDGGRVRFVVDIVNKGTFPAIADVERFTVLTLGPESDRATFDARMLCWGVNDALEREPITLTPDEVTIGNPETRTLLSAPNKLQYQLALDIHRRLPILGLNGENPWGLVYTTLFHSSGDSGHFLRKEDLEADGWQLGRDKLFRHPDGRIALPVLEGQLINQFDHRAKSYEFYAGKNKYGRKPHLPPTTDDHKVDPQFEVEPRYWMRDTVALDRLADTVGDRALLAIRDVSRPWTDQRSAKAALIPRLPVTDTIPVLALPTENVLEFLGVYNSTAFDFIARIHMPGGHLARTWILSQLAAPKPGIDERIGQAAGRLSVTSLRLAEEYELPVHTWDPSQREKDWTELDALVAKTAYDLARDEYEIVLDSFDVLRRAEEEEFGEYRFKRLCLEAYDRL